MAAAAASKVTLNTVVFFGSSKDVVPPWGGASRLGDRVLSHVLATIKARNESCGGVAVAHKIDVFDPLVAFREGGPLADSGAEIRVRAAHPAFLMSSEASQHRREGYLCPPHVFPPVCV